MAVTLEKTGVPATGTRVNTEPGAPVHAIAGKPVVKAAKGVRMRVHFTRGCSLRYVSILGWPTGEGSASYLYGWDGGRTWLEVIHSPYPARIVADAWEYDARRTGVYAGRDLGIVL